jgi:hypothetical protein
MLSAFKKLKMHDVRSYKTSRFTREIVKKESELAHTRQMYIDLDNE